MRLKRTDNYGLAITDDNGNIVTVNNGNIPDLHLYLDTSGSASENDHAAWVISAIALAKQLGINLYVHSFSDMLSRCKKLKLDGKSEEQVYADYLAIPKMTGGTNYDQIWRYINKSAARKAELSLIVTDFEWLLCDKTPRHPANLYYVPFCNTTGIKQDNMAVWAGYFMETMDAIDPTCRERVLI